MSSSPHAPRPPIGGAAITASVVGFFSVALLAGVTTLFIGLWKWVSPDQRFGIAGPMLVGALGLGASACAWGAALLIRRKIEWIGGGPLAVLGAILGAIAVVGSLVFFILFAPSTARSTPGSQSTTSTSAGPIVR